MVHAGTLQFIRRVTVGLMRGRTYQPTKHINMRPKEVELEYKLRKIFSVIIDRLVKNLGKYYEAPLKEAVISNITGELITNADKHNILDALLKAKNEVVGLSAANLNKELGVGSLYNINDVVKAAKDEIRDRTFKIITTEITPTLEETLKSQLEQGYKNGWSMDKVAANLDGLKTNALTIARTELQSSVEGGNFELMKATGEAAGVAITKTWITAEDERVRESHRELNGVTIPIDEPFANGLMYPSDYSGAPEEVINCRCDIQYNTEISTRTEEDLDKQLADLLGKTAQAAAPVAAEEVIKTEPVDLTQPEYIVGDWIKNAEGNIAQIKGFNADGTIITNRIGGVYKTSEVERINNKGNIIFTGTAKYVNKFKSKFFAEMDETYKNNPRVYNNIKSIKVTGAGKCSGYQPADGSIKFVVDKSGNTHNYGSDTILHEVSHSFNNVNYTGAVWGKNATGTYSKAIEKEFPEMFKAWDNIIAKA